MLQTVCESLLVGSICAIYQSAGVGYLVLQAAVATFTIFGCLTAYCFKSKKDFSFLGGFLFSGLVGLLVVGLIQIVLSMFGVRFDWLNLCVSVVGVLIFSGYILFDTSMLIHKLSPDEYILATVNLYMDLINLFLYILQLLSQTSRD